ncbi:MAG: HAMP domain-containing methyl-accepting chemotaxis protein [Gallionella sp.]|jgi:methyl-accepting chemotaxis protein
MLGTIRAKIIGLSVIALLFTALLGGVGYYIATGLTDILEETQGKTEAATYFTQQSVALEAVRADVLQILRSKNIAVASPEAANDLNEHLKIFNRKADTTLLTEPARQAVTVLSADADVYAQSALSIAALAPADSAGAEAQYIVFEDAYKKVKTDQGKLNNVLAEEMAQAHLTTRSAKPRAGNIVLAAMIAALILLSLFAFSIYRRILNPLNQLRQAISNIEESHYETRVNFHTKDEIGSLGRAFDRVIDDRKGLIKTTARENERINNSVIGLFAAMGALSEKDLTVRAPVTEDIIGTLGDAINQLTDVTATVLHHVTKVAGVVEDASARMKKQSDVVNEMAKEEDVIVVRLISNLETAMASIGEVAIFARDSNRAAAEATKSTESAMQTVQATLVGMNAIRETISEMEKRIKRLGERSQEISQIVNLINTISERTHVLSLNAAMQAAMAGEAGRGFAVVAEEVQRLAENSRQATGQIANLVQNIQVETNDTIATVNKTIEQVVKESDLAHSAGERMRETHEATARLVRLVATIATSSAEQTKIAVVLRAAADEIAQFTEKTAQQLVAQNQSAASLVSASQKLVGAISVFKLPQIDKEQPSPSEQTQIYDPLNP